MFIDFIDIIAEPNQDFSHSHFELKNLILAQKMMFITPSTFIVILHFLHPLHVYSNLHAY